MHFFCFGVLFYHFITYKLNDHKSFSFNVSFLFEFFQAGLLESYKSAPKWHIKTEWTVIGCHACQSNGRFLSKEAVAGQNKL